VDGPQVELLGPWAQRGQASQILNNQFAHENSMTK
jgi:hypothetical protein